MKINSIKVKKLFGVFEHEVPRESKMCTWRACRHPAKPCSTCASCTWTCEGHHDRFTARNGITSYREQFMDVWPWLGCTELVHHVSTPTSTQEPSARQNKKDCYCCCTFGRSQNLWPSQSQQFTHHPSKETPLLSVCKYEWMQVVFVMVLEVAEW